MSEKIERIRKEIRLRRIKSGYTQDYISKQLGISQYAYYKIESGKTELKVSVLLKMMEILDVSFEQLIAEN